MKESKAEPVAAEKLEKQEENFQIGTIRWDSYTKSIEGGTDSASQVAKQEENLKNRKKTFK